MTEPVAQQLAEESAPAATPQIEQVSTAKHAAFETENVALKAQNEELAQNLESLSSKSEENAKALAEMRRTTLERQNADLAERNKQLEQRIAIANAAESTGVPAHILAGPGEDLEAYGASVKAYIDSLLEERVSNAGPAGIVPMNVVLSAQPSAITGTENKYGFTEQTAKKFLRQQ